MGLGWLRFILSMMVLDQHLGGYRLYVLPHVLEYFGIDNMSPIGGGAVAVTGFFVLSGYLIAHVLQGRFRIKSDTGGSQRVAIVSFYISRILRIYPLYWLVLIMTAIIFAIMGFSGGMRGLWSECQNFILFGYGLSFMGFGTYPLGGFETSTHMVLPQAWTVSLDVLFYLLAPFIVLKAKWRRLMLVIGLVVIAAFAFALDTVPAWFISFYSFGWVYWLAFLLGAEARLAEWRVSAWVALLIMIVPVMAAWSPIGLDPVIWQIITIPSFAVLVAYLGVRRDTPPLDRFLGELTYALYLIQLPVLSGFEQAHIPHPQIWTLVTTFALAIALSIGIERPLDRLRRQLEPKITAYRLGNWETRRMGLPMTSLVLIPLLIYVHRHVESWSNHERLLCPETSNVCQANLEGADATVLRIEPPVKIPSWNLALDHCKPLSGKSLRGVLCVPRGPVILGVFRLPGQTLVGIDSVWVHSYSPSKLIKLIYKPKRGQWIRQLKMQ